MKIGVAGCSGRVGALLVDELLSGAWSKFSLAGGTVRDLAEKDKIRDDFFVTDNAQELFDRADCVIDFTRPDATMEHAAMAAKMGKSLIIGTTGMSAAQEKKLTDYAKNTRILYAANMSVGVNLLLALVEKAAAALESDAWDIEIFESHHKHKIDAPSGTALAIGQAAAKGRGVALDDVKVTARDGITGEREAGSIGFSVARGGDVVGEHTAFFYGAGERIELSHISNNRALYARGALQAAAWLEGCENGLYSMRDVLDL